MKITVTQEDIDKGKRNMCSYCPVALACTRQFNATCRVEYETLRGPLVVSVYHVDHTQQFNLPFKVQCWVSYFDFHGPDEIKPIEFELTE